MKLPVSYTFETTHPQRTYVLRNANDVRRWRQEITCSRLQREETNGRKHHRACVAWLQSLFKLGVSRELHTRPIVAAQLNKLISHVR